jgi:uncharacterized protein involved in outer membrane biogenesis
LFAYLRNADLSIYQDHIESFVSNRIGHTLEIGGRFELRFGRTTTVVAEGVALSNSEWPENTRLISVGNVEFSFNTWSLLSQPFIIEELSAHDIQAHLARDEAGKVNWAAELPARPDAESGEFDPNRIAFRVVDIEGIDFTYTDPARPRPVHTSIDRLTISPDVNDILDLDITGEINDLPLWADGKLGPWQNFVDGRDILADLDVTLGPVRLAIEGVVADLVALEGVEFNGVLAGPEISRVLERLALPPFAKGAFELTANIQQLDSGHQLRLDGNLGDIDVFVSGNFDQLLLPQQVAHDFSIAGPDAHFVAELFGFDNVPAAPFQISGDYARSGLELTFTNTILNVGEYSVLFSGDIDLSERVPDLDLQVSASGPDFSLIGPFVDFPGLPQKPFTITGRVQKEVAAWLADGVDIAVGENRLTVNGELVTGSRGTTQIDIRATGPDISFIQKFTSLEGIPSRPYDISATIRPDPLGIQVDNGLGLFGDNRIGVDGVIAFRPGLDGTVLDVELRGPELRNLRLLAGVPNLPGGSFDVDGRVEIHGDAVRLDNVEAVVGELQATASGDVFIVGIDAGDFDLEVSAGGPDVMLIGDIEPLRDFAGDPFSIAGNVRHQGGMFSATNLEATLGSLSAQLQGYLVKEGQLADITIAASAADSDVLRKLVKSSYLPDGRVLLEGKIEKSETDIKFTDTTFSIGEHRLTADGSLNLTPLENDSNLEFKTSGPSLTEIGRIFGNEKLPDKEYSVSGKFHGTPKGFAVRNFLAQVGDSDLLGEFSADLRGKPQVKGVLVSTYLDITDKTQIPDDDVQAVEASPDDSGEFLFSDERLETGFLQAANLDLGLEIDELVTNVMRVTDVRLGVKQQDGALTIDPIQLRDEFGSIAGNFSLAPRNDSYVMRAMLNVDGLRAGLSATKDQDRSTLPPISGQLDLNGTGSSIRTIMASSNGSISFRQGTGTVKEVFGSAFFKDVLLQVLRTLNPLSRSRDYQVLECGIYDVSIVDGRATIDKFIIQTDTMTTVASGTVNLRNEKLDIAFRAKPREGIGISFGTVANQLLELRGTLKAPRVAVDAGRTATTTGAAVATGGLSLLARGLWDRLSAEADICEKEK